jgi:hypothetical protein
VSDLQHKSNKTMDNSSCPSSGHQSGSLRGQEDPSPIPPQCATSIPVSAVIKNAVQSRRTKGGGSPSIYPRPALLGLGNPPPRPLLLLQSLLSISLLLSLLLLDPPPPEACHGMSLPFLCFPTAARVFLIVE